MQLVPPNKPSCDCKILTKIRPTRIDNIIQLLKKKVIDPEETGFITGRQSFCNMRKLLNVLYTTHAETEEETEVEISLNVEKAFDHIEWQHLFVVSEKNCFDHNRSRCPPL